MVQLREERSHVIFRQVVLHDGEANRGERLIGFATSSAERDLAIAAVAFIPLTEA